MTDRPNPDRSPLDLPWPSVDRRRGHVRMPLGTVIPFPVIRALVAIAAVLIGLETTFGLSNWITVPVVLLAIGWAGETVDEATIRYDYQVEPDDHDGATS